MWETQVWFPGWTVPLEKDMSSHSCTLAWKVPWMEEPSQLQSMGLQTVAHDWATSVASLIAQLVKNQPGMWETGFDHLLGRSPGEGKGYPLQYSVWIISWNRKDSDVTEWLSLSSIPQLWQTFGLPCWLRWWSICLLYGRPRFDSWVGKIPWRRKWQPTRVLLPGKSHGQKSLVGYNP